MQVLVKRKIHHYLIPHESNNFRAKALHHTSIIFYIFLLIVFQASINFIKHTHPGILGYATDITVEKLLNLVNQKRIEANLPPLTLSSQLSTAATQKAADMFTKNYWAHVSPTGVSPWAFITSSGYDYLYAGENLAKDFNTNKEVVEAWLNSPTHKANILKPEYTEIGLAVMNGKLSGEETTLVVQHFGSKVGASASIPQATATSLTVPMITPAEVYPASPVRSFLPLSISKNFSLILAEFLLLVLFIDSLYIWRHKTIRLTGHSLAHIIFLMALVGAMGATGIGVIL